MPSLPAGCGGGVTMACEGVTVTIAQLRGGRAMLGWTTQRLAVAARVHRQSIGDIEKGRVQPQKGRMARLVAGLEWAGVVFAQDGSVGIKADILEFSEATSKGGDT
jgi:DNA-binding XRE family transcriptional regulator